MFLKIHFPYFQPKTIESSTIKISLLFFKKIPPNMKSYKFGKKEMHDDFSK